MSNRLSANRAWVDAVTAFANRMASRKLPTAKMESSMFAMVKCGKSRRPKKISIALAANWNIAMPALKKENLRDVINAKAANGESMAWATKFACTSVILDAKREWSVVAPAIRFMRVR